MVPLQYTPPPLPSPRVSHDSSLEDSTELLDPGTNGVSGTVKTLTVHQNGPLGVLMYVHVIGHACVVTMVLHDEFISVIKTDLKHIYNIYIYIDF